MPRHVSSARFLKGSSKSRTKKILASRTARMTRSMKMGSNLVECPPGMIMRNPSVRKSFHRRSGTKVHSARIGATCIKDVGKPGKGKMTIVLDPEDHYLSEFGYEQVSKLTKTQRMAALKRLMDYFIPIKGEQATMTYIIRALNARYVLNRNTNPKIAKIFKADQRTVSEMYAKRG